MLTAGRYHWFFFFKRYPGYGSSNSEKELSSLSSGSFRHMQPPSVTSHIHEHVDLHTSLILFLVPVSSGVEADGRYRPGSPERVGWGRGWVAPTIQQRTRTRRRGKMQSRCHCCLSPARNRRREFVAGFTGSTARISPPRGNFWWYVWRGLGRLAKLPKNDWLAAGRWKDLGARALSWVVKRECSASCREPVDLGASATAYQPVHL